MLDWLGERHHSDHLLVAARAIEQSVDAAFGSGKICSFDIGGADGTAAIGRTIAGSVRSGEAEGP
jgi:hypothetical protein